MAFCSDLGITPSHGAAMLSVLLGSPSSAASSGDGSPIASAACARCWPGRLCQIVAMVGFLLTRSEAGLFAVATFFGLGFSGMIPAYVLAVRELFPRPRQPGGCRPCCCSAVPGWRLAAGWPGALRPVRFLRRGIRLGIVFNLVNLVLSVRWCSASPRRYGRSWPAKVPTDQPLTTAPPFGRSTWPDMYSTSFEARKKVAGRDFVGLPRPLHRRRAPCSAVLYSL